MHSTGKDLTSSPDEGDTAAGYHWFADSDGTVIMARAWRNGDLTGFTTEQLFVPLREASRPEEWEEGTSSEEIAQRLASGELTEIGQTTVSPFPNHQH